MFSDERKRNEEDLAIGLAYFEPHMDAILTQRAQLAEQGIYKMEIHVPGDGVPALVEGGTVYGMQIVLSSLVDEPTVRPA